MVKRTLFLAWLFSTAIMAFGQSIPDITGSAISSSSSTDCGPRSIGNYCLLLDNGALFQYDGQNWNYQNPPTSTYKYQDTSTDELWSISGPNVDYIGTTVPTSSDLNSIIASAGSIAMALDVGDVFQFVGAQWQLVSISYPIIFADDISGELYSIPARGTVVPELRNVQFCPDPIPTMSQWALFILGLSLTSMAVVTIRKRVLATA